MPASAGIYRKWHEQSVALDEALAGAAPSVLSAEGLTAEIHTALPPLRRTWTSFEQIAHGTFYQSYLWCSAWLETVGRASQVEPVVVILRDGAHRICALLPLQIRRVGKLRILEWLAAPSNNYGYALYHPDFVRAAGTWLGANWPALVRSIGRVDAVVLRDNPERMADIANPLTGMFTSRAANRSYVLRLSPDFASLYGRKRDGDTRRTGRKKEKALSRLGTVEFGLPQGREETRAVIETMFAQQQGRLAEHGIHNVFGPAERAFIHRIAELQDESRPALAPYTLKLNGSVLAVYLGGLYKDTFWALISSLAAGPERKYSPGDIALRLSIERCCAAGLSTYDFSAGSSRYKLSWSDDIIQLHDIIEGTTLAGAAYVAWLRGRSAAKRYIKESDTLLRAASGLRRLLRGQTPVRPISD